MKIAHCTQFSALSGGVEQTIWTLSDYFIRAGHHVDILSYDGQKPENDKRGDGVRVRKIEIFGITKHSFFSAFIYRLGKTLFTRGLYELLFSHYASWRLQKRYLDPERYDVIFLHTRRFLYFRHVKRPHVLVFHSVHGCYPFGMTARAIKTVIYRRFFRAMVRNKIIFAVSEHLRQKIIRYCGVNPNKVHCVYNPIDTEKIQALAAEKMPQNAPKPYIVSVARLVRVKALDVLIRAYAESAIEHQLILLGDGPLRGKLQALVRRLDLEHKVRFLGHCSNPFPYIKNAELLVLSSKEEGLPVTIIEAMLCGTKVVATRTDGACEIMGAEAEDCLAPIGDCHALADKIRSALKTNKTFNPKSYQHFQGERVAQAYLHYAQQLCIKKS